jgi:hypothetical protein
MAILNAATKEIQLKIVYYGPALCGKTTNLVQVHKRVQTAPGNKGRLVSLATNSDRTLFFDFCRLRPRPLGFKNKVSALYSLGRFTATRQLVWRVGMGCVVADSHPKMAENVESFQNLEDNPHGELTG